jgi:hypothetical protein
MAQSLTPCEQERFQSSMALFEEPVMISAAAAVRG